MNKNKEWAKGQLEYYIKAVGDPFNSRTQGMIDAYKNVEHIINQLDEPKNEENFYTFDNAKKWLQDNGFVVFEKDKLDEEVQRMIDEAYKEMNEKTVIPQFVADWIETHNLYGNNPLREYRDLENDFDEGWTDEEDAAIYHWINKNPYAFIDAIRYGYEVEKEKKYYVDLDTAAYVAKWDGDGSVQIYTDSISGSDEYELHLTEKEIKDYDKRFWAFAEEVTK